MSEGGNAEFSAPFRGIVVGGGVKLLGKRGGYSWVGRGRQRKEQHRGRDRHREKERERERERQSQLLCVALRSM